MLESYHITPENWLNVIQVLCPIEPRQKICRPGSKTEAMIGDLKVKCDNKLCDFAMQMANPIEQASMA